MRIRTIKPEFFTHDGLYEAEKESKLPLRIAFIGLWCAADREGRFRWEPRRLGALILPYDRIDFARVLETLAARGFIVEYRVGESSFGAIPSWSRHQIVNNREAQSVIPHYADCETLSHACPTREPRVPHACPTPVKGKGREGEGEGKGKEGSVGQFALSAADAAPTVDDSEWLDQLSRSEAYRGIDVPHELAKMRVWCAANRKTTSRKRLINWLNRCEKPIAQTAAYKPAPQAMPEPRGWETFARSEFPEAVFFADGANPTWASLARDHQRLISERMGHQ